MKSTSPTGPRSPLELLRPMLWMAAVAFAAGFGGYLAVGLKAVHAASAF
ncbi:hypothetical protein [Caulobacter segnis]|jgi:hypothetical protein|nr:hypothetical protein [Caulobacter segnis]UAL10701.1 hypothetical protein K8940_23650 [Caulobacter segnis]